ncbi:MAG TPA: protein kinase [Phycisphaerae bacterium]|nr:protein kinase [Phycisphaerae bacterium]HRW55504.1 protein kinase [Phycisphaerae bacterium]
MNEIDDFHEALEQPEDQREAFIEQRHAGNPERIDRLRRLLAAHQRAENAPDETIAFARSLGASMAEQSPQWIGPYRVLSLIGEGGMGIVYAAEQLEPIRRRVAIKVVKLGMDTKEVIARFEAERQALAMLDHPGIAKVLDAGSTESGRPYFVMDLVKGLPLTEYCAKYKLSLRDRLGLFVRMCEAVQHAHQRGIIHRDLKPPNVLVAMLEGRPVPKVIDFGIAKATASRLSERTVFTEQGKLIGTPEYMSPEQAEMSGLDVDTRTDVYSLGVLLYELLTSVLPFEPRELRSGGYATIQRIIRDVDPPRPSTRLSNLSRSTPDGDRFACASVRQLRGELDWIVMRAIEKDRTRRYESVGAMCQDVERYLADEPVSAGPPSNAYKFRKFIKRHRYGTLAAASALLAVTLGVTGLTIGLIDARQAHAVADRRAKNAQAAAEYLQKVLFQVDPEFGGGRLSLQEVIDAAAASVSEELGDFPEVEASVRESIGVAYRRRSEYAKAQPHLQKSLEIRRSLFGDTPLATASSFIAMADLSLEYEGSVDDALRMLGRSYDSYVANGLIDSEAEAWLQLDIGLANIAGDRLRAAEQAFDVCRKLLIRSRGAGHPDISRPERGLALVALGRNDLESAERLARHAVALCDGEGEPYLNARARLVLAQVLMETNRFDEVADILAVVGEQFLRTVGKRHIRITELDVCLAELYLRRQEFSLAEKTSEHCEILRRELLDRNHWAILEARLLRQRARIGAGDAATADVELLQIAEAIDRSLGGDHPLAIAVASARVDCSRALGNDDVAAARAERLANMKQRRAERLKLEASPTAP